MKKRSFSEERRRTYCSEHQAILDALVSRDRDGARAGDAQPSADRRAEPVGAVRPMMIHEGGCHCGAIRIDLQKRHAGSRPCACAPASAAFAASMARVAVSDPDGAGRDQDRRSGEGVALPFRASDGRLSRLPRLRRLCRRGHDRGRANRGRWRSSMRSTTAPISPERSSRWISRLEEKDDRMARRRARWTPTIFVLALIISPPIRSHGDRATSAIPRPPRSAAVPSLRGASRTLRRCRARRGPCS